MKINNINNEYLKNMQNKIAKKEKASNNIAQKKDSIDISKDRLNVKNLKEKLYSISEIREAKVKNIKEAIANGQYKIDSRVLAEKMLEKISQD